MTGVNGILTNVEREFPDYLRDESRRTGRADSISFPKTEDELKSHLAKVHELKMPITLQGARTGITGGAVPDGGHILNFSRMNRILGLRHDPEQNSFLLIVQPGVLLSEIHEAVAKKEFVTTDWSTESLQTLEKFTASGEYFFPPDPTEATASIGGMAACNASGARSFFYGPTRKYVKRLRVILADGSALELCRSEQKASGRAFSLAADSGRKIEGNLPAYEMPDVKNAAGYFVQDDMDLLDLFIGSEGTLGILSEIELQLIPMPAVVWGVMAFLPGEGEALRFVRKLREVGAAPSTINPPSPLFAHCYGGTSHQPLSAEASAKAESTMSCALVALEFFDCHTLDLLRQQKKTNPAFKEIPDIPSERHTAVYVEYHGDNEETVENAVMEMSEMMVECGGNEDATWLASDDREMERLKNFRHAIPEAVNLLIDERRKKEPGLTKLGTDLAVSDSTLEKVMALYHRNLDENQLEYVMFGHIGNNHIHVNIIPNSLEEYERGKNLYLEWARTVVKWGGTVSAEHGIGKLKTALLREMYGEKALLQMRELKKLFDPENMLNPGNLFEL